MRGAKEISKPAEREAGLPATAAPAAPGEGRQTARLDGMFPYVVLVVAAIVVAYSPVLFNFFVGDDFVHLTWLKEAVQYPELIWRNFHSSWLDGTTTKFYRPLISVFMVTDYLTWGLNGLGFHITNLCFHIASTIFMYLIVGELVRSESGLPPAATEQRGTEQRGTEQRGTEQRGIEERRVPACALDFNFWPIAAAAIFGLYPLHPEAVSWITGRVDAIVTTFSLASVWLYMRWSRHNSGLTPSITIAASLAAFVLGLLSKEMAITIPAVVVAYEFIMKGGVKRTILKSLPFWIVLAGYFVVRRLALGTMVGGYDDSLLFIADLKAFVLNWLHALRMTVVPLNKELFGAHHWLTKSWEMLVALSAVLAAVSFIKNKEYRRPALFMLGWLVLSLVPVYKIFAISDDLQGSRLAYLATAPLAALLAFGMSTVRGAMRRPHESISRVASYESIVQAALIVVFSIMCGVALSTNNEPWRQAGLESNAIRSALETIYAGVNNDPQTLIVGLPDQIHGAYVCRNALWGMMKRPQLSKDVQNCLMVNEFEPVQPFGFLKQSLIESRAGVRIFQWQPELKRFQPIELPTREQPRTEVELHGAGTFSELPVDKRPSQIISCSDLPCWFVDFVRVNLDVTESGKTDVGADLLYANNIDPQFKLAHRAHADMQGGTGKQSLLFSLRSLPEWALGADGGKLKLLIPPGCRAKITAVRVVPHTVLMPSISFANSGYMGTKGYLHLGKDQPDRTISVDGHQVAGARSTALEVTRANLLFEEQNGIDQSKVAKSLIPCPLTGQAELHVKDFAAPGIYEARLWAKDEANKFIGVSSDHIVLSVDP